MRRPLVDMNNLMFPLSVPFAGSEFHNIITDGDHQICHIQHLVLVILLGDAYGPEGIFVVIRNDAFGHHGIDHRDLQDICEASKSLPGVIAHRTVSHQDHRVLCLEDHGRRLIDTGKGCVLLIPLRLFQRLCGNTGADRKLRHVRGKIHMTCSGLLTFRIFKSDPDDFIDGIGVHDLFAPLSDWCKQLYQIQILMRSQMHPLRSHLSGNGNQRCTVGISICRACDQVRGTGAQR